MFQLTLETNKKDVRHSLNLPKHFVAASGVVLNEQKQVLLQKRADKKTWELPGGVIELDEKIEDGAVREIFEETGMNVKINCLSGIYKNLRSGVVAFNFLCEIESGTLTLSEETIDVGFFPYDAALNLIQSFRHLERLKDAYKLIEEGNYKQFELKYN